MTAETYALPEIPRTLSTGLDYYKPTMSQLLYEQEPDAEVEVTFRLHNRGEQRFADYVDPADFQKRLDETLAKGWSEPELAYLAGRTLRNGEAVFSPSYINHLRTSRLPRVDIFFNEEIDDLDGYVTGPKSLVTFWETVVMSELSEAYFEGYLKAHGIDPTEVYEEGDRRLTEMIGILQRNPDIKFADFGTRRRFSQRWHAHVIDRLVKECPDNLLGTSNIGLADHYGIKPIGTFAHELPMVYAALADARGKDVRASHHQLLEDWYNRYGEDYAIALTDTYTTDFFLEDFTAEQAAKWRGVRLDSGDPFQSGERIIQMYEKHGIDPRTKLIVPSDSLDINKVVDLHDHFKDRIPDAPGVGTKVTNNLGLRALNVVMKAVHVRDMRTGQEADTVKLSDDVGKHLGPPDKIALYKRIFGVTTT